MSPGPVCSELVTYSRHCNVAELVTKGILDAVMINLFPLCFG